MASTRSSSAGSASTSGRSSGTSIRTRRILDGAGQDLGQRDRLRDHAEDARLQPAHVEEVLHQAGQLHEGLVGGLEQFGLVGGRPRHVGAAQALDRRLGRGERGAQVVADGGEQGGPHAVGLGQRLGLFGLLLQPALAQRDGRLGGEGLQDPAVGGARATGPGRPAPASRRSPRRCRTRRGSCRARRRRWRRCARPRGRRGRRGPPELRRSSRVTEVRP